MSLEFDDYNMFELNFQIVKVNQTIDNFGNFQKLPHRRTRKILTAKIALAYSSDCFWHCVKTFINLKFADILNKRLNI